MSGAGATGQVPACRDRIEALARVLRGQGGRVVVAATRRPVRTGAPDVGDAAAGAPDWQALVGPADVDDVVTAKGLDAFFGSDLELVLHTTGTRRLLLAGAPLETSVHSTLRTANDRGIECLLLQDACVPADAGLRTASLSMVEMSGGVFGAVGSAGGAARSARTDSVLTDTALWRP